MLRGLALALLLVAGCAATGPARRFDWSPSTISGSSPPLLLVHGIIVLGTHPILGLTTFAPATIDALTADGFDVWLPALPAVAPPHERADALLAAIDEVRARTGAASVLIVAHSQAGVDVRVLLDDPRAAGKIAGVVTISSPHRGTPLATLWRRFRGGLFESAIDRFALDIAESRGWGRQKGEFRATGQALSPAEMEKLSRATPAVPFFSVAADPRAVNQAGDCQGGAWPPPEQHGRFSFFMWLGALALDQIAERSVASDGVVPVASQRFGIFLGCVPVDHAAWLHPSRGGVDVTAVIVELARGLRDVAAKHDVAAMAAHADRVHALIDN